MQSAVSKGLRNSYSSAPLIKGWAVRVAVLQSGFVIAWQLNNLIFGEVFGKIAKS